MLPPVRSANPAMERRSVVFPQPLGPSSVKNSFRATENDTPSRARTFPPNTLDALSTVRYAIVSRVCLRAYVVLYIITANV